MKDQTASERDPVVVIGGGIAGLAAAFQLHRDGMPVQVYEAAPRVGGKIRTTEFHGGLVDEAADAFLARVPHGIELARELGIDDQLIAPTARKAQIWAGQLSALPEPHVLGIPLDPAAAAELLGPEAATAIEADLGRTEPDPVRADDTIGSLVRRRVGDRVHEALVDPLIGAINAGDTDQLSLAASSPQILGAAMAGPSLIEAFRRQRAGVASDAPVFYSFAGGMTVLVDALEAVLHDQITLGVAATAVDELPGGGLQVQLSTGETVATPAVVLATPARVAAEVVGGWPDAAVALNAIPQVSVTLVTLAYPAGTIAAGPELSGFVVPRDDAALTITACSYATNKWPHLSTSHDLLRVSVGHGRDQITPQLPDEELLAVVKTDLATALHLTEAPIATRISRWPGAFPQYTVGHLERLAQVEGELNPAGVFLAGMSYRGIGIPASIDAGRSAAVEAILHVLD